MRSKRKTMKLAAVALTAAVTMTACGNTAAENTSATVSEEQEEIAEDNNDTVQPQESEMPEIEPESEPEPEPTTVMLAEEREERIREIYLEMEVIEQTVRTLAAERMENTSFVTVDPREKYDFKEALIDEVSGNAIVGEGIKSALGAIAEQKSIDEILEDTIAGGVSGIQETVESMVVDKIKDTVTDSLGVDIFAPVEFMNKWNQADGTPKVLLQNIVDDQREDVLWLDTFLTQPAVNAADMYRLSQVVYGIHVREQEIAAISGEQADDTNTDYRQIEELAGQYAALEGQLLVYAGDGMRDEADIMTEDAESALTEQQEKMKTAVEELSFLEGIPLGHSAVNYDAAGFVEAQRETEQTKALGGFLGDFFGGLMAEDLQYLSDDIQNERSKVYVEINNYLNENYQAVINARASLNEQIGLLSWAAEASENERYDVETFVQNTDWESSLMTAQSEFAEALAKYEYDLSCIYMIDECILSEYQEDFLDDLYQEWTNVQTCLERCTPENEIPAGYTDEEKAERYVELVNFYVDAVDFVQVRGASLGETPGFHSVGSKMISGSGTYTAYSNGDKLTLIVWETSGHTLHDAKRGGRYYFDAAGNPIFIRGNDDTITLRNGEIVTHTCSNENQIEYQQNYANDALRVWGA